MPGLISVLALVRWIRLLLPGDTIALAALVWVLFGEGAAHTASAQAGPIVLEVACFRGGYGIDFYEMCAREFEVAHPGVKINLWGNPRVWDQLTPRFAAGNPPDLVYPGWGMNVFALIMDGQVRPLDQYLNQPLDQPTSGTGKTWGDSFFPLLLSKGAYDGKRYTVPYNYDTFGWWYNKGMFEKHGWKPPQTRAELLTLCEAIRKKDLAPVTFTGRYPQYMLDGLFFPWAYRAGGQEVLDRVDRLEPGAWLDPAFLLAARDIMEMKRRGDFQTGCIGMSHTESQMEFLVGRAAMIPNGTWLYSEMKRLIPPGFQMEFIRPPLREEGAGDPTAVQINYDGKGWFIPAKAKHPDDAALFLQYLTSPANSRRFVAAKGTFTGLQDISETEVPPHLRGALQLMRASKANWVVHYAQWYPELGTEVQNAIRDLYNELHTPEEFVARLDAKAADLRKDPSTKKFGAR